MNAALNLAMRARLLRLLADRPEFCRADRARRIDAMRPELNPTPVSPLDVTLAEYADETDLMCGYAVRILRKKRSAPIIDLLSTLSSDRVVAMYYALPADRREAVAQSDGAWTYYVHRGPSSDEIDAAAFQLEEIAERSTPESWRMVLDELDADWRRFRSQLDHRPLRDPRRDASAARAIVTALRKAGPDADPLKIVGDFQETHLNGRSGPTGSARRS
jgi:hypothetical protein